MQETTEKPIVIVVGVDYSETGALALTRAFELAAQQPLADVHIVNVARAYGPMVHLDLPHDVKTLSAEEASQNLKDYVEEQIERFRVARGERGPGGFARAITHLRLDAPAAEIAQLASDLEADMVIVGTHGRRGFSRVLLGSVAEGVVRLAPCPVLVVRPKRVDQNDVPEIEPPCPECVETRKQTGGNELWCEQHRARHGRRHTYHYVHKNAQTRGNAALLTDVS